MRKRKIYKPLLFIATLLFLSATVIGQIKNNYKFIEPNISISYDSNFVKITNRYSNTFWETESYDFEILKDTIHKPRINIKADIPPYDNLAKNILDSSLSLAIEEMKNVKDDTFSIIGLDKSVRTINGFSCIGFVGFDKYNKTTSTRINCYHHSDNDNTLVEYLSKDRNDLEKEYEILTEFLNGFKAYTKNEIEKEDKLIKQKYTAIVLPTKKIIDNFKYRTKSYLGVVRTKQKLEHKIKEVRLTNNIGKEIFYPEINGEVPIVIKDEKKGRQVKKGELIILNSFGKNVKIEFSFTYINNGILLR